MSLPVKKSLKVMTGGIPIFGLVLIGIFATLTAFYSNLPGAWLRILVAAAVALLALRISFLRPFWKAGLFSIGILALALVWRGFTPASNSRDWKTQNAVVPTITREGDDLIEVKNVRNFHYRTTDDFDVLYDNRTYDLRKIQSVDFVISYWGNHGGKDGIAHTLLTFGFEGDQWLAISIEIRSEKGESFHPIPGWFQQYELIYVAGDERDIIGLRADYRKEKVYLYPSSATPKQARELFVNMLTRANELAARPEFYSSIGANCTTCLIGHMNAVLHTNVPFSGRLILNGLSDRFAYEHGYLITDLPFQILKNACLIEPVSGEEEGNYSAMIRKHRDAALKAARENTVTAR